VGRDADVFPIVMLGSSYGVVDGVLRGVGGGIRKASTWGKSDVACRTTCYGKRGDGTFRSLV
jgi:hypothetical protein